MTSARHFPSPVTTMFARRVKPGFEAQYEEWLAGISNEAAHFRGNQGTTVLQPSEYRGEYVAITQFASAADLELWLCSREREQWLDKLDDIALEHEEIKALTGMERWFTLPDRAVSQAPERYKMALLILLGLYPLVLALSYVLDPITNKLPRALGILVSLLISVPLMVWLVMPWLTRLFFDWLYPKHSPSALTQKNAEQDA